MKETILDVLMFMFQSYIEDGNDSEIDRNFLHKNLSMAGFADKNIEKALDGIEIVIATSARFRNKNINTSSMYKI